MKVSWILFLLVINSNLMFAQEGNTEIFIIDSYVTPEAPYSIKMSFFTSNKTKSSVVIDNRYNLSVSEVYTEDHTFEMKLSEFTFDSTVVPFYIVVTNENESTDTSEIYDLALPEDLDFLKGEGPSLLTICCFGGVIFGMPAPVYVELNGESYLSLTKEVPLFSIYSAGYNYPVSYFSLEYAYVFNAPVEHFLRAGYKYVFQTKYIEYISPGINVFSDFQGFNGFSPELTIGWAKIYNAFTLYSRYRYNFKPSETNNFFHEISIGLYSNFFSFNF